MATQILIVDDEIELRKHIEHILTSQEQNPVEVTQAIHGQQATELLTQKSFDLIFLDVKMPVLDGLEALPEIKKFNPHSFVVVMTAHSNISDAVRAMKMGCYDYIEKPIDKEKLIKIFNKILKAKKLVKQASLRLPIIENPQEQKIISESKSMQDILVLIQKISQSDSTVLLQGENGTGKELIAKAIHYNSSKKDNPFVGINCAAIDENLLVSELFGHEKNAFPHAHERRIGKFQMAHKGTLFLNEIGELSLSAQSQLLRVLKDRTFTPLGSGRLQKSYARIIAATSQNLEKLTEKGLFREDLYFRLNVIPVTIPSLKERKEDIPSLVGHFLKKYEKPSREMKFSPRALKKMLQYAWPGNIRELENVIQRVVLLSTSHIVEPKDLPGFIAEDKKLGSLEGELLDFEDFKKHSEKAFIEKALTVNRGKINQTVVRANIPKNTLLRKIKKFEIDVKSLIKN